MPPLWRESRFALKPRGCCAARSGTARASSRRRPAGAARAGIPGRRRLARDDDQVATRQRLLDEPGRDPRQRRLLAGGLRPAREAAGDAGGPHGREGRDRRPEPRRRARARGRRPPPRPRVRDRDAGRADRLDAQGAPARAAAGRRRRSAGHRPRARPDVAELPARGVLRELPRRPAGAVPIRRPLRVGVLTLGRDRRLARLPGPRRRSAVRGRGLALRHGGQRAGLPLLGTTLARFFAGDDPLPLAA